MTVRPGPPLLAARTLCQDTLFVLSSFSWHATSTSRYPVIPASTTCGFAVALMPRADRYPEGDGPYRRMR